MSPPPRHSRGKSAENRFQTLEDAGVAGASQTCTGFYRGYVCNEVARGPQRDGG